MLELGQRFMVMCQILLKSRGDCSFGRAMNFTYWSDTTHNRRKFHWNANVNGDVNE